jgi:hypothetical protein
LAGTNKGARQAVNTHTQALLLLVRKKTEVSQKCAGNLAWLFKRSQPFEWNEEGKMEADGCQLTSQLRDSAGFAPDFPGCTSLHFDGSLDILEYKGFI